MWPGLEGWCKEAATDLKSLFEVPSLLALMPRSELWEKPFAEWTREDWRTCGLTALWDINTGDVLWAKGAHSEAEMRLVGKPIREFVGQLKAGGK